MTDEIDESTDWKAGISEEYLENKTIQEAGSINDLAKMTIEAQKMVGGSIRPPGPDAGIEDKQKFYENVRKHVPGLIKLPELEDSEGWDAFYNEMGRPEEYAFDGDDALKKTLHSVGLNEKQATAVNEYISTTEQSSKDATREAYQAEVDAITKEWGDAAPHKWQQVKYVAEALGGEELQKAIDQAEPKVAGQIVKVLDWIVNKTGEQPEIDPGLSAQQQAFTIGPEEAKARIQEIRQNKNHIWHNSKHPRWEEANAQMQKYYEIAYPEKLSFAS